MSNILRRVLYASAMLAVVFISSANAQTITIATVPIGNSGNANDSTGFGSVAYNYSIATYDVTVGQYTAFLNAVASTDTYSLYNPLMATDLNIAGIAQSGSPGSYTYNVIGSPNKPITYVGWFDAARFANWLNNGQLSGPENSNTTETGAYTLNGANPTAVTRNANVTWVIPTENEWYKAAYYDPAAGHYWNYATGTNTTPTSAPPGSTPNTANFFGPPGPTGFAVTGSAVLDDNQNYLTDVGAYAASASPYGTFDQCGDVDQWNETFISGFRGKRGSPWNDDSGLLPARFRFGESPTVEYDISGFRVAYVPEPNTGVLAALAGGLMLWWRPRK